MNVVPFTGRPRYDFFIERVEGRATADALQRWKALRNEGWDVEALYEWDGGCVIGLGCLYPDAGGRRTSEDLTPDKETAVSG